MEVKKKKPDLSRYERIAMDAKGNLRDAWNRFIKQFEVIEDYKTEITTTDRLVSRTELKNILTNNVCEIVFVRRRPERAPGRPEVRRMLCTISENIFMSENAVRSLNFRRPKTGRRLNEAKHNIVVVWDIFMQDYRNVSMDTCYLRQTIPDDDTFWKYYNNALLNMSAQQKMNFMDSVY